MARQKDSIEIEVKLREFIRKFHINKLYQGGLLFISIFFAYFLILNVLEHFNRFDTTTRTILFFTTIVLLFSILFYFVIIPILGLLRIRNYLNYDDAAKLIGQHFPEVKDKLLNTIQLSRTADLHADALLLASIKQKTTQLQPIPFIKAIDVKKTRKFLRIALIPLIVILFFIVLSPSIIAESTKRLIDFNTQYIPPAPFEFKILNKSLVASTQQDLTLEVETNGKELPKDVYIQIQDTRFKLRKEEKNKFSYEFKNIQKSIQFKLFADGYYSQDYELMAITKPDLKSFTVELDYPDYTGLKDEKLSNVGDLTVVQGTKIKWNLKTENIDLINFLVDDSVINQSKNPKSFETTYRAMRNSVFGWNWTNSTLQIDKKNVYQLQVIPDQYPSISVNEVRDTVLYSNLFFTGIIDDDYGFKSLTFNYEVKTESGSSGIKSESVQFNSTGIKSNFYYVIDFSKLQPKPGEEITYYFEVGDNDQVNGSKKTRSVVKTFKIPTLDELNEKIENQSEQIKADMKESILDLKKLQKEIDELNLKLLQQKDINWQDKKKLQELLDKQKKLQEKVEKTIENNQNKNKQQEQFSKQDESLLEKQKELEKMLEKILSPEMKEKLREIEKALENLNKDKMKDFLEKMKFDNKDLQKELDRQLELFKQLEFDKKLTETIDKLDQLAEKQEKLSNETQKNEKNNLSEEQKKINEEFKNLQKDLDDLQEKNKSIEEPIDFKDTDSKEQDIQNDLQNSQQELNNGKNSKAAKSQKSASDKMKELSKQLKDQQEQNEAEQQEEDLNKLRELLENVVQLSFDQEALIKKLDKTAINNPQFVQIIQQQKKIKDDAAMIEDSLLALSKRVIQIKSFINKEIGAVNMNMEKSLYHLAERQIGPASSRQQFVMTSLNNLALMLNEVTDQMMQQMAQSQQQKQNGGSCKKPGKNSKPGSSGKPSMATMKMMQQQLNEQLEKLKKGMQNPNGKEGMGQSGSMSEQLARMAAQQEAIRNELQKMMNEMMKNGQNGSAGQLQDAINKMDKTESDLVNKNITQETLKRQQEILTRLLEAEKAERERDEDEKRKSNENIVDFKRNISEFLQYNKAIQRETELLKTISPQMKPFYKNLVKEYFNTLN